MEDIKSTYKLLKEKNYNNVIKSLEDLKETITIDPKKRYNIAMSKCRHVLESFYKRLLINHNINKLFNGKDTEKGTMVPLAETVRKNIEKLFKFPIYSKNMEEGFQHLIESSKNIVSGLADDGGVHGKSEIPEVSINQVKATISYISLLIKTLLPFEIYIDQGPITLTKNQKKILKLLQPNRKDYTSDDIKKKIRDLSTTEIEPILDSLVDLNFAWMSNREIKGYRISDLGKDFLSDKKSTIDGEFLIGMIFYFGDVKIKITDMSKQKYSDYYDYEITHGDIKTINSVHVESRKRDELIEKIKAQLSGEKIF